MVCQTPSNYVFKYDHSEHPVIKRLLAYWIMTYGTIRLVAGIYTEVGLDYTAAFSYFIEALCFEIELYKGKPTDR